MVMARLDDGSRAAAPAINVLGPGTKLEDDHGESQALVPTTGAVDRQRRVDGFMAATQIRSSLK
jgi:hypothetical protein